MKALVYTAPQTLVYRDEPDPKPGNNETIVDIEAVGICGSDMHAYLGHDERRPPPLILGHEAAGVAANGIYQGCRVVINPLVTCQTCEACRSGRANLCAEREIISMPARPGAFAGKVVVPDRNLIVIPDHVESHKAALAEPIACSYHAVRLADRAADRPMSEARSVVLGGGAIGLAAALVLADFGCKEIWIAETNAKRHGLLKAAGDFQVYNPADGQGPEPGSADIVIDAFGGQATRSAASSLATPGGVIAHIGLAGGEAGLDIRRMTLQEITFIGTYTYTELDFIKTADALFAGRFGPLDWLDRRPLCEGAEAFEEISAGNAVHPKIVLHP